MADNIFDKIPTGPEEPRRMVNPGAAVQGASDENVFDSIPTGKIKSPEGMGVGEATAAGAVQGATMNFADELSGIMAGAGHALNNPNSQTLHADIVKAYEKSRDSERAWDKEAREQHPIAHMGGELGGAILPALVPIGGTEASAANAMRAVPKMGDRMLQASRAGAGYGATAGFGGGEGTENRVGGALTGMVGGAVLGPVGVPVAAGMESAVGAVVKRAQGVVRGLVAPDNEAARRAASWISSDRQSGRAGLTDQEFDAAKAAGVPVANVDLGGGGTLAGFRSSANTSPQGRMAAEEMTDARFRSQSVRAADTMRDIGGGDAYKTRAQLQTDYDAVRGPAYRVAYTEGDKPIYSKTLDQLASSPAVEAAMKAAITSGKDRAVKEGHGAFNPPIKVTPDGRIEFVKGETGVPAYPNLQFWDQVKRELSDAAGKAYRGGANGEGDVLAGLSKQLTTELDKHVPAYSKARGLAADYFGANDALEAGETAVTWRGDPREVRVQIAKMQPAERALFREGFASKIALDMESTADNVNITNKVYSSPQKRKMIDAVFGEDGSKQLEMFIRRESIMDKARKVLSGSTTAAQLIEAGLAGGTLGAGYGALWEGDDIGGIMKRGAQGMSIAGGAAVGARTFNKLVGYIDQRTAHRVAELLTSDDREAVQRGLKILSNNDKLGQAFRNFDNRLAGTFAGEQASGFAPKRATGDRNASQ